ncbi:MAG: hypothetical protein HFH03_12035 [Dorea sp.]|jgi:uncharacterized membrane protein|nr:hypothetical protein [Dorea sp.]
MRKYLKDCKRLFPIYGNCERKYLERLKNHIQEYQLEHEHYTYDDLVAQFGTPTEVTAEYYNTVDDDYLLKRVNFKGLCRIFAVILLSLALIFICYKTYIIHQMILAAQNTTIISDETIEYK